MSQRSGAIIKQCEGRVLRAFGEEVTIHLDGERTGGKLTMWTEVTPPGGGPPPHYHVSEDETFHVIEGRVAFLVDGKWNEVGPGGTAFMPRGVVHTFKNASDQPSTHAGHDHAIRNRKLLCALRSGICQAGRPPDMTRLVEIGVEHGIHFVL